MCKELYKRSIRYFSKHVILNSLAHVAGGFGLALLLQHYFPGTVFLSLWVGWALLILSAIIHMLSFMK